MIYDSLDISDYPCEDSIVIKILDVIDELTDNENREWCERQVINTFSRFEFFIDGLRDCQVDYFGTVDMIYDYLIDKLLTNFE